MTTKITTLSHLLIISLLSLSFSKTTATYINPLSIPSCYAHPALLKCVHDIQSRIGSIESGNVANTISIILDSINSAKASYFNVLHFLSSHHVDSHYIKSVHVAINIAVHELNESSKVLNGKKKLSSSELHKIQNCLKIAHRNVAHLIAGVKHGDANIHLSLGHLINQSINLTVLSLKIVGQLNGKI